jgi:multisubunit Na+/H+ antiporter MnhE subunit
MTRYVLFAFPLALFWMGITNRLTLESFLVGYLLGIGGTALFRPPLVDVNWRKLPGQLTALLIYIVVLYRDILLSGIGLARRVLSRDMNLKLGIIAVPIQDPEKSQIVAALSADVVTLTPGELVVEIEDNSVMYVHCLDIEDAEAHAADAQAKRLHLLQRILGR